MLMEHLCLSYNRLCISKNQSKRDNNSISNIKWYVGVYNSGRKNVTL